MISLELAIVANSSTTNGDQITLSSNNQVFVHFLSSVKSPINGYALFSVCSVLFWYISIQEMRFMLSESEVPKFVLSGWPFCQEDVLSGPP